MIDLSADDARRLAVSAQGLSSPPPPASSRVDRRHLRRMLDQVQVLQIDSVSAVARSHELVAFARLGHHPRDLVHRATYRYRDLYETWAHQASLAPVALEPLLRWRRQHLHHRWVAWAAANRALIDLVLAELDDRGPLAASDLRDPGRSGGPWWDWSPGKTVLEYLFAAGHVAVADRRPGFERVYDRTERVLPAEVLATPDPGEDEARRRLLVRSAHALGVATAADLFDYFRQKAPAARPRLAELVESGELVPASVEGWTAKAYVSAEARPQTRPRRAALLSPFDSLVWARPRTERLFGFRYRIEIYTPEPKRVYGYYVLPFLLADRLVARVDVRADRAAGVLRVPAAHVEAGADPADVAPALADQLYDLAAWLGLRDVTVERRGDLSPALRAAVAAT